ncbi:hypothetical protein HHK36_017394 [Tetracentron sinense]|uniref:Protein kinase domain-containing protein n=1 Tax=Tetracentron sinense TaxID=13715 RepID=A0A834Z748_TETSI|nr:hypothetical protein HHK36_017394 [Tetracentron sinense]
MAKPSTSDVSSDEDPSNDSISSEEEQKNEEIIKEEDEEELEAVARMAGSDDNESGEDNPPATDDDANGDAESDDEEEQVGLGLLVFRINGRSSLVLLTYILRFLAFGDDDFCSGGSLYANPIDSSLLLSLGSHVDGAASTGAPVPPPFSPASPKPSTVTCLKKKPFIISLLSFPDYKASRERIRLDHLDAVEPENLSEWNNTRMKRILVDYMLRLSYYDTAMKLAESNNLQVILLALIFGENLKHYYDLVDIDVFHEAKKVIDALQKKEVAPALAWCAENKSKLKKSKVKGEANISYICSRYYRAPELIFGATEYTTSIDIWSAGCVLAELLLGQPLFPGESAVDQLVEIIKVLGTPTREEIRCMNPNYTDFRFPQIKAHPWHKVFHKRMPPEAIDLASRLLQYSPSLRCNAVSLQFLFF